MRASILRFAFFAFFFCLSLILPATAQQNTSGSDDIVEGIVISASRATLVVRSDDNQFHLFTFGRPGTRPASLTAGVRVRVTAETADENGTRVATNIVVISTSESTSASVDKGAQAAPVPEKVRDLESDLKRESRRWHLGVRAGAAFDPELFMFGVHSQMGPIFNRHILFRPSAEFDFGEVTDLIALNFEPIYRLTAIRQGKWTPYVGAGPAMIFIHQSFQQGRDISFGNFDYETGFNVLVGMQSRKGGFLEMKSSLWSGPAPKLRLIVGYNF